MVLGNSQQSFRKVYATSLPGHDSGMRSHNNTSGKATRRKYITLAGATGMWGIAGCLGDDSDNGGGGVEMEFASPFQEGAEQTQQLIRIKDKVEERTDGDFEITVSAQEYGGVEETFDLLVSGAFEGSTISTTPFTRWAPGYAFPATPLTMKSVDHVSQVFESDYFEPAWAAIEAGGGVKFLGNNVMSTGSRVMVTKETEITHADDVDGLKYRSPQIRNWQLIFEALDMNITAIAWNEVYSALRQGTVDGAGGTALMAIENSFDEVADYINEVRHYAYWNGNWVRSDFYESLSEEYQDILAEASNEAQDEATKNVEENEDGHFDELEDKGMTAVRHDEIDYESFRNKAEPALEQLYAEQFAVSRDKVDST